MRKKGASQGAYVLTCAHVLGGGAIIEDPSVKDANLVYAPELKRSCGLECNRPVGQVVPETLEKLRERVVQALIKFGQEVFAVDAALVELVAKAEASNEVPDIGPIASVRDLIQEWSLTTVPPTLDLPAARQITVKKYGATTFFTEGKILKLARQHVKEPVAGQAPIEADALVLEIEVKPGQKPFSAEYELDMAKFKAEMEIDTAAEVKALFDGTNVAATVGGSTATPTLKIVGHTFSQKGDSGAPVVDDANRIVAILRSGTFQPIFVKGQDFAVEIATGNAQAVFIAAALEKLQVTFLPAGQNTAGASVIVPGMALERPMREAIDWAALDRAQASFDSTPTGARLGTVLRRHYPELRELVHHRRHVKVTWHRFKGPAFVSAFLRGARRPGWPIPAEIDGVRLIDALQAMRNVLLSEGGPTLGASIREHEQEVMELARDASSLDDLLRRSGGWGFAREDAGSALGDRLAGVRQSLQIANARGVPGTAGALVRDAAGARYLLTNHHVLFGAGAAAGEPVFAISPDGGRGGRLDPVAVGRGGVGFIGRVSFAAGVHFVDCALVALADENAFPSWLADTLAGMWPSSAAAATPGARVTKDSAATGTTEGVVVDAAYTDHPFVEGRTWTAPGQLLIDSRDPRLNFSGPGDSGAAVIDQQGCIVGLLWGSNETGQGLASPIDAVLDCLHVTLEERQHTVRATTRTSA